MKDSYKDFLEKTYDYLIEKLKIAEEEGTSKEEIDTTNLELKIINTLICVYKEKEDLNLKCQISEIKQELSELKYKLSVIKQTTQILNA